MLRPRMLRIAAALSAAVTLASSRATPEETRVVKAGDPRFWYGGRTEINADGSRSFDWEGTAIYANIVNASFVKAFISTTGPASQLETSILGFEGEMFHQTTVWVSPRSGTEEYLVADGLDPNVTYTLRMFHVLEPSYAGAQSPDQFFTFKGVELDGNLVAATPQPRRLEIVGDSISAGYGAQCTAGGKIITGWNSGNFGTYNRLLCDYFGALCSIVAWSGKGMYKNCCDEAGETMPEYYLQTRGGEQRSQSWDFERFVPDALIINLGTNDFTKDTGDEFRANFTDHYVKFVLDATQRYKRPSLPVFVAQGPMNNGAPLHDALQVAIQRINSMGGNATYLDMRGPVNDGCNSHPGRVGNQQMFEKAAPVIAEHMGWQPAALRRPLAPRGTFAMSANLLAKLRLSSTIAVV